uniref:TAFII55 protein conserved region domain-containing protein n=1 Tax=Zea mays TaxID=4577 RepID=A0A804P6I3_MAIZE
MEEQFILRVPPSVAERIERLMNESAASSSNPHEASLDLSFSACGKKPLRKPRFMNLLLGNEVQWGFQALGTREAGNRLYVGASKALATHEMIMVREENDPAPEGVEYKHGLTPPMRDARRRRFRREPDLNAELVNQVEKHLISIMHGVSVNMRKETVRGGGFEKDRTEGSGSSSSSGRNDCLDVPRLLSVPNGNVCSEGNNIQKSTVKVGTRSRPSSSTTTEPHLLLASPFAHLVVATRATRLVLRRRLATFVRYCQLDVCRAADTESLAELVVRVRLMFTTPKSR